MKSVTELVGYIRGLRQHIQSMSKDFEIYDTEVQRLEEDVVQPAQRIVSPAFVEQVKGELEAYHKTRDFLWENYLFCIKDGFQTIIRECKDISRYPIEAAREGLLFSDDILLAANLEILGQCYHYFELLFNHPDSEIRAEAYRRRYGQPLLLQ